MKREGGDQESLFAVSASDASGTGVDDSAHDSARVPLAVRMRPRALKEMVGQQHVVGEDCLLPRLLSNGFLGNILLYGPPGCGKTSLARVLAEETGAEFVALNAVLSNVAELRDTLKMARYRDAVTVLFIDEIHRFNKAQQDLLLHDVEAGTIQLIGATTHNPGFYIVPPLLSRSHLFRLEPLAVGDIVPVLGQALRDEERGLGARLCQAEEAFLQGVARISDGDLRRALNALETIVLSMPMGSSLVEADVESFARQRQIRYDRNEDDHYDTISAYIKSMRGGDPDAAIYWLAKMLAGGEDPRFVARRLVIFASEDIGLADSRALPVAVAAWQACDTVGLPECELNLAHATVFMATSPKSNAAYQALGKAKAEIKAEGIQEVPLWLKDTGGSVNKALGHGKDYEYSHGFAENISGQEYMMKPKQFYFPKNSGSEAGVAERLARWAKMKEIARQVASSK